MQENKSAAKAVNKNFYKNKEILSHSHLSLFLDNEKTAIIRNSRSGFFRFPIKSSFIAANMISPKLHSLRFSFDKITLIHIIHKLIHNYSHHVDKNNLFFLFSR